MGGNAGFAKLDFNISSRQLVFLRLSTSRYSGTNNVFFDPASPITQYTEDNNGTEDVATESLAASWTSIWSTRWSTNLRGQFSRDLQQSFANSDAPKLKIYGLVDGMGRSNILPRETREHKLHLADTANYNTGRNNWKFGGDFLLPRALRRRVLLQQCQGQSLVLHSREVWRPIDPVTGVRARRAPLLCAGLRQRGVAS